MRPITWRQIQAPRLDTRTGIEAGKLFNQATSGIQQIFNNLAKEKRQKAESEFAAKIANAKSVDEVEALRQQYGGMSEDERYYLNPKFVAEGLNRRGQAIRTGELNEAVRQSKLADIGEKEDLRDINAAIKRMEANMKKTETEFDQEHQGTELDTRETNLVTKNQKAHHTQDTLPLFFRGLESGLEATEKQNQKKTLDATEGINKHLQNDQYNSLVFKYNNDGVIDYPALLKDPSLKQIPGGNKRATKAYMDALSDQISISGSEDTIKSKKFTNKLQDLSEQYYDYSNNTFGRNRNDFLKAAKKQGIPNRYVDQWMTALDQTRYKEDVLQQNIRNAEGQHVFDQLAQNYVEVTPAGEQIQEEKLRADMRGQGYTDKEVDAYISDYQQRKYLLTNRDKILHNQAVDAMRPNWTAAIDKMDDMEESQNAVAVANILQDAMKDPAVWEHLTAAGYTQAEVNHLMNRSLEGQFWGVNNFNESPIAPVLDIINSYYHGKPHFNPDNKETGDTPKSSEKTKTKQTDLQRVQKLIQKSGGKVEDTKNLRGKLSPGMRPDQFNKPNPFLTPFTW